MLPGWLKKYILIAFTSLGRIPMLELAAHFLRGTETLGAMFHCRICKTDIHETVEAWVICRLHLWEAIASRTLNFWEHQGHIPSSPDGWELVLQTRIRNFALHVHFLFSLVICLIFIHNLCLLWELKLNRDTQVGPSVPFFLILGDRQGLWG